MTLETEKARQRADALASRARCHAERPDAGTRACRHFLEAIGFPDDAAVSAYLPVRDEFDVMPLAAAAHAFGHRVGMPVVAGRGKPLLFREWTPQTALVSGVLGIPTPPAEAPALVPRLLLVPLLAFDREGYRLGYGGGFYDRTVAALRALDPATLAVGIGFAGLEVEDVPHGAHDARLDWIVTEEGATRF